MTMLFFLKHNPFDGADAGWPRREDGSEYTIEEVEEGISEIKKEHAESKLEKEILLRSERSALITKWTIVDSLAQKVEDIRVTKLLDDLEQRIVELELKILTLQVEEDEFMLLCLLH